MAFVKTQPYATVETADGRSYFLQSGTYYDVFGNVVASIPPYTVSGGSVAPSGSSAPVYAAAYLQPWNSGTTPTPNYTKTLTAPAANFTASCSGVTATITATSAGAAAVGQSIFGGAWVLGTVITAIGTYNGVSGTVTVSPSQTTVSTAACGVVSQTPGGTFYPWHDNTSFTTFGGARAGSAGTSGGYCANATEPSASDQIAPQYVEVTCTGRYLEVAQRILGANTYAGQKSWIGTGVNPTTAPQQTQFAEPTVVGTNVIQDVLLTLYDFGTSAQRTFTVLLDQGFVGMYADVKPSASLRAHNGKVMAIEGDSWLLGNNAGTGGASIAGNLVDNFPWQLAMMTGHDDVVVLGEPGTGWFNDGNGLQVMTAARTPYYSSRRVAAIIAHRPATVLIIGSVNDIAVAGYNTNIAAKVTSAANQLIANLSQYTNIFIAGGQYANLYTKAQYTPIDTQIAAGIAACSAPARIKQIICTDSNTTAGTPWLTGTGNTVTPAADGNSDQYLDNSRKHINRLCHQEFWPVKLNTIMTSLGV